MGLGLGCCYCAGGGVAFWVGGGRGGCRRAAALGMREL